MNRGPQMAEIFLDKGHFQHWTIWGPLKNQNFENQFLHARDYQKISHIFLNLCPQIAEISMHNRKMTIFLHWTIWDLLHKKKFITS